VPFFSSAGPVVAGADRKITAATFENVRRDGDGFVYHLGHSKTNQSGRKDPKSLKPIQGPRPRHSKSG
jgi:hypothetical protein